MPLTSQNLPQNSTGPTLQCSLASKLHFGESFYSFYLKYLKSKVLYSWFLKSRDLSEGYQTVPRNNISSEACNQDLLMNKTPSSDKIWQHGRKIPNGFTLPVLTIMLWEQDYNSFFLRGCLKAFSQEKSDGQADSHSREL